MCFRISIFTIIGETCNYFLVYFSNFERKMRPPHKMCQTTPLLFRILCFKVEIAVPRERDGSDQDHTESEWHFLSWNRSLLETSVPQPELCQAEVLQPLHGSLPQMLPIKEKRTGVSGSSPFFATRFCLWPSALVSSTVQGGEGSGNPENWSIPDDWGLCHSQTPSWGFRPSFRAQIEPPTFVLD